MQFLIFAITYPIIWLLSLLPMKILYLLSDFLYLIFFYIIGYRKKVVLGNLQLAFPKKELDELRTIQKKFFKANLYLLYIQTKKEGINKVRASIV